MSVSFLDAAADLLNGLLTNLYSGSVIPGITGANSSLGGLLRLS
ncbi:hypothetical protein [Prescottella sp. R16]|nr:hypothetical protein [Prescottella sp. R16]